MSRVRNALKRAGNWDGAPVTTRLVPQLVPDARETPVSGSGTSDGGVPGTGDLPPRLAALLSETEEPAAAAAPKKSSRIPRWLPRRCRRLIRTHTQVARCSSVTRRGLPCRGPAMDNGLCRMHG